MLKLICWWLVFASYKAFLKSKKGLELVSMSYLLQDFLRKIFITLHSFNWPNFIVWLPLLLFPTLWRHIFWYLSFLIKPFSNITERVRKKYLNILRTKRTFTWTWCKSGTLWRYHQYPQYCQYPWYTQYIQFLRDPCPLNTGGERG